MKPLPHEFTLSATPLVSETASPPIPAKSTSLGSLAPAARLGSVTQALAEVPTLTPTSLDAPSVSGSAPGGKPSPVAKFIARLQSQDVDIVETALLRFKEAYSHGDQSVIEEALIEQATLLNAVGLKLLMNGGDADVASQIQLWSSLGLRAIEMARKSLETLISARNGANRQTNVQVNVGVPTNELKSVPNE